MKKLFFSFLLLLFFSGLNADEGMWLPMFLKYNEAEMREMGFRLTAEDVYSVNKNSMKDAVVLFGGGCTGELISPDGLLLTNHHCGYSFVQRHSSMEHNYLQDGFWARTREEELPNQGLTVTFLVRMEEVTDKVLAGVKSNMTEEARNALIQSNVENLKRLAVEGTHYTAVIKPFYYGNQYIMFVNETFEDVRLVGAPPESIGKFGGDTDNWMWPRHTGDFSLFRIYTDKDGNPAPYSKDNIPLKSKQYFTLSTKGVVEDDFTLVFGYPGTTRQFLLADGVDIAANVQNPIAVKARTIRLDAMKYWMAQSPEIRLMYSAKANSISNGWKKWQGESMGIEKCNVLEKKQLEEMEFERWVAEDEIRKEEYGNLLPEMRRLYAYYREEVQIATFNSETFFGVEILKFLKNNLMPVIESAKTAKESPEKFQDAKNKLQKAAKSFFKSYNANIDAECFVNLMVYYFSTQNPFLIPDELQRYINASDVLFIRMADGMADKYPYFTASDKFIQFLEEATPKDFLKLEKNEIVRLISPVLVQNDLNVKEMQRVKKELEQRYRIYVKALMEQNKQKDFYPDANLTLRVTYGQVKGFSPSDGKEYVYYTTLDGIMEKENPEVFDYKVAPKLKELYEKKDYGRYANALGEMPVAFIATNHTTGGNSGSPVINADGELVGVNFDRVWEGTMSDMNYDVRLCRNISLDIRYFLFIVDKFAGAENLLSEMNIK